MIMCKKQLFLFFLLLISMNGFAQVGNDLCRHFIIAIDKYPNQYRGYTNYVFSQDIIDFTSEVLTNEFKLTGQDYVSILYYGIGKKATSRDSFITVPYVNGQAMLWISSKEYEKKWEDYNLSPNNNTDDGDHYSMQRASYSYSFYKAIFGKTRLVNQTFLLRITDDQENNFKGAEGEHTAYLRGSNISESQWMAVIDSVENSYSFEEIRIDDHRQVSINGDYGVYICQVVPKDKPTVRTVVSIDKLGSKQTKQGHLVSFSYNEKDEYSLERLKVDLDLMGNLWETVFDTIASQSGNVEFLIPENLQLDSIRLSFSVWGASKSACGAMVISPWDTITGMGSQLMEVKHLKLERASILGIIPLSKEWLWFSDNAERAALIWTIILIVSAVVSLFLLYFILRRYRITPNRTSLVVLSKSPIIVDLIDKTNGSEVVVADLQIRLRRPVWERGRKIKDDISIEIHIDKQEDDKSYLLLGEKVLFPSWKDNCIKDYDTGVQVYACPDAILDNSDSQTKENVSKPYSLPVSFWVKDKKGTVLLNEKISFDVRFKEIIHEPEIGVKDLGSNETSILEIQYEDVVTPSIIGSVFFKDTISFQRKPQIQNCVPHVFCDDCEALSVGNKGCIVINMSHLSNPAIDYVDFKYMLNYTYSEIGYDEEKSKQKEFVLRVKQNQTAPQLRVWFDDKRKKPREKCELKNGDVKDDVEPIFFIPQDTLSEFWNDIIIENAATQGLSGAAIKIENLDIKPVITQQNAKQYESDIDAFVRLDESQYPVIMRNVGLKTQINPQIGWNSSNNRRIVYDDNNGNRRYDITVCMSISFDYAIDKLGNGSFVDAPPFNAKIVYKVYQDVHREWLGIDFGTSAIVSQYNGIVQNLRGVKKSLYEEESYKTDTYEEGTNFLSSNVIFRSSNGGTTYYYPVPKEAPVKEEHVEEDIPQTEPENEDNTQNNQKQIPKEAPVKEEHIEEDIPQTEPENEDNTQNNQKQIPKEAPVKEEHIEEDIPQTEPENEDNTQNNQEPRSPYHFAAICLSPTSSLEQSFNTGILPCLKLMVGYEKLPMLSELNGQSYSTETNVITFGTNDNNPLAKVENVFREVYNQLLRFFILPEIQGQPIDNIVLTVPNTYTSSHIKILEECIKRSSIGKEVRKIQYVSESDSVACYYQSNWALLNIGRDQLDDETIMVYDMGAGTLDISLLHRRVENNQTTLSVIGKIGVGRAGNYLDTVLAETIARIQPESGLSNYIAPSIINDTDKFKKASAWKQFIKDVIKPKLSETDESYTLQEKDCNRLDVDNDFVINLASLRESEEYLAYIESCSTGILDGFFKFLGYDKENHRPIINTLVLSGRASNQNHLIEKLQENIIDWCGDSAGFKTIPLWEGEHDASKTAVIEGAVNLVSRYMRKDSGITFISSNITADYGIIYKDASGKTCFMKLLDHTDAPDKNDIEDGVKRAVYHREYEDVDLRTVNRVTLIQTFTKEPIANDGSLSEYCTVMGNYNIPNQADRAHLTISIDIDKLGQISISIDGAAAPPQAATQVDLNSEIYKKGLWPMLNN